MGGGADPSDRDSREPNPFGTFHLTDDAPRSVAKQAGGPMFAASATTVATQGTWQPTWPTEGIVEFMDEIATCVLYEDGDLRCPGSFAVPAFATPAARAAAARVGKVGCTLSPRGEARCWGAFGSRTELMPTVADRWREIDVSSDGTFCAITWDGEGWCEARDDGGPVPLGGTAPLHGLDMTSLAACAVDADGRPACVQLAGDAPHPGLAAMPDWDEVTAIALSLEAVCMLRRGEQLGCWGEGPIVTRAPTGGW